MTIKPAKLSVVILAAGESRRMGRPKLILPWRDTTVLGQVLRACAAGLASDSEPSFAGLDWELVVVTGGVRRQVESLLQGFPHAYPLRTVFNPTYGSAGMLGSVQAGLASLGPDVQAALIGLGDQPQVLSETIRLIITAWVQTGSPLVIPSYQDRRGHPWLVSRSLWPEILSLPASATSRDFLNAHLDQALYIPADESILQDLDTPEEYDRLKP